MRQRLLILLRVFIAFVAVFVVMKPVFMLYNGAGHGLIWTDWLAVPAHGLTLDLTTAGYLTALPWLALTLSLWGRIPWVCRLYTAYAAVVAILLAFILVGDVCLYSFWHFKLDATVFNYLDQPADIAASVSTAYLTVGLTAVALLAALIFWLLRRAAGRSPLVPLSATSTTTEKTSTTTGNPIAATEIPIAATDFAEATRKTSQFPCPTPQTDSPTGKFSARRHKKVPPGADLAAGRAGTGKKDSSRGFRGSSPPWPCAHSWRSGAWRPPRSCRRAPGPRRDGPSSARGSGPHR